eukprot:Nitzschia sp. Nitz4//scaffold84_size84139//43342//45303//NITZ4_005199-RA/size84139-processed-gene-0.83-mRNA-1//1//CDS//3329559036//551//frame0
MLSLYRQGPRHVLRRPAAWTIGLEKHWDDVHPPSTNCSLGSGASSIHAPLLGYNMHSTNSLLPLTNNSLYHQQTQLRHYWFLPVSWAEFSERWQRWVEQTEQRWVRVKLLRRERRNKARIERQQMMGRFMSRTQAKWNSWYLRQTGAMEDSSLPKAATPLSTAISAIPLNNPATFRSRYNGWKARRKDQYQGWKRKNYTRYQGWKLRQKERYQAWKLRRQQQIRGWRQRRQDLLARSKKVLVQEYSRPEWFDDHGRPLTARDSTGRFVNPWQSQSTNGVHSLPTLLRWQWQRMQREINELGLIRSLMPDLSWNSEPPPVSGTKQPLPDHNPEKLSMTWLGHSSCWVQMDGYNIITDPIYSLRASPFQTIPIGVPRVYAPSHSLEELLEHAGGSIDVCLLTHDHYDHLDLQTSRDLAPHVKRWVVPSGIKAWLMEKCRIPESSIVELEWWQHAQLDKGTDGGINITPNYFVPSDSALTITCCPASHWGGRTMFDRNFRLWCSFALNGPRHRFFFCGDTGYPENFPLFHQIGDALGPFDLACIPIGAYEPAELNHTAHVNPFEAVRIHKDISSRHSVAMHWGVFPLSEEVLEEPPMVLEEAMQREGDTVAPFHPLQLGGALVVETSKMEPPYLTSPVELDEAVVIDDMTPKIAAS